MYHLQYIINYKKYPQHPSKIIHIHFLMLATVSVGHSIRLYFSISQRVKRKQKIVHSPDLYVYKSSRNIEKGVGFTGLGKISSSLTLTPGGALS